MKARRRPHVDTAHDLARKARVYLDAPGFYAVTLKKGGVEVGARVACEPTPDPWEPGNVMDRPLWWSVIANGEVLHGPALQPTWTMTGRRIDRAEYDFLIADRAWASANAPHLPEANPRAPVDLRALSPDTLF